MGTHRYLAPSYKNLVWATWRPGFVHSWSEVQISRSVCVRAKAATRDPVVHDKKKKDKSWNKIPNCDCSISNENSLFSCLCFRFHNVCICEQISIDEIPHYEYLNIP